MMCKGFLAGLLLLISCVPAELIAPSSSTRTSIVEHSQTPLSPSVSISSATNTLIPTSTQVNYLSIDQLQPGEYLIIRDRPSPGFNSYLNVVDAQGNILGKLLSGYDFMSAAISPNNRWMVFSEYTNNSTEFVHIYDLQNKTESTLATNCSNPSSSWSPDGLSLAVSCNKIRIFSYIDGAWTEQGEIPLPPQIKELPQDIIDAVKCYSPAWSPDGEKIAFICPVETGQDGPYIVKASCATKDEDCFFESLNVKDIWVDLQWSDNPFILGVAAPDSNSLILYDIRTGKSVKDYQLKANEYPLASVAWSPDNDMIAFQHDEGSVFLLDTKTNGINRIYSGDGSWVYLLTWMKIATP